MNEAALVVNEKLVEIVGVIVFIEHAFYSYALQIYTNFLNDVLLASYRIKKG